MTRADRARVRALNDLLRIRHRGGVVMLSAGVKAMGIRTVKRILCAVAAFDSFTPDNDPYGEHDYGSIVFEGRRIAWKIDYYDTTMSGGSSAPADPDRTTRVMTVMLVEEY
jgi:hypothetical protein